eukprot:g12993.t1
MSMSEDKRFDFGGQRFRSLPKSVKKVKVDKRFAKMFTDEKFQEGGTAKVDKTGKPKPLLEADHRKDEVDGNTTSEDTDWSDSEDSYDPDEGVWDTYQEDKDVERCEEDTGCRLAFQGLDWDCVTAEDIFLVASSFVGDLRDQNAQAGASTKVGKKLLGGRVDDDHEKRAKKILSCRIYRSEAGEKALEYEAEFGPQVRGTTTTTSSTTKKAKHDSKTLDELTEAEQAEEIRRYNLKKLQYFFAVVLCDSRETCGRLYDELDGHQIDSLCNGRPLDVRQVPDEMGEITDRPIVDECTEFNPAAQKASAHVLSENNNLLAGLSHTKAACNWDEGSARRKKDLMKKFSKKEMSLNDLETYLADSDSEEAADVAGRGGEGGEKNSEDEAHDAAVFGRKNEKKKKLEDKRRLLLGDLLGKNGGSDDEEEDSEEEEGSSSAAVSAQEEEQLEDGSSESDGEGMTAQFDDGEDGAGGLKQGAEAGSDSDEEEDDDNEEEESSVAEEQDQNMGAMSMTFNTETDNVAKKLVEKAKEQVSAGASSSGKNMTSTSLSQLSRKEPSAWQKFQERKKEKRREKKQEMKEKQKSVKEAIQQELLEAAGGNKGKKKSAKQKRMDREAESDDEEAGGSGAAPPAASAVVADSRFSKLFSDAEFGIDPTRPEFTNTEGMKELLKAKRKTQSGAGGMEMLKKTGKKLTSGRKVHYLFLVYNHINNQESWRRYFAGDQASGLSLAQQSHSGEEVLAGGAGGSSSFTTRTPSSSTPDGTSAPGAPTAAASSEKDWHAYVHCKDGYQCQLPPFEATLVEPVPSAYCTDLVSPM